MSVFFYFLLAIIAAAALIWWLNGKSFATNQLANSLDAIAAPLAASPLSAPKKKNVGQQPAAALRQKW